MRLLLLLLLVGCAEAPRPYFQWDLPAHPHAVLFDGTIDQGWTQMVEAARAEWSTPLVEMGCEDPFRDGVEYDVTLIPDADWTRPDAIGDTERDSMTIKGTTAELIANMAYQTLLPHELGHAIGLSHVLVEVDPDSIMHEIPDKTSPDDRDLLMAAAKIGCR